MDNNSSAYYTWYLYILMTLVCSFSIDEHWSHLAQFLKLIRKRDIVLSKYKMVTMNQKIDVLGLHIKCEKVKTRPRIAKTILRFPSKIESPKQLQCFPGCTNFFLPSRKTRLLWTSTTTEIALRNKWWWADDHTSAIMKIKEKTKATLSLRIPIGE